MNSISIFTPFGQFWITKCAFCLFNMRPATFVLRQFFISGDGFYWCCITPQTLMYSNSSWKIMEFKTAAAVPQISHWLPSATSAPCVRHQKQIQNQGFLRKTQRFPCVSGSFIPGLPVQPVVLRYLNKLVIFVFLPLQPHLTSRKKQTGV